MGDGVARLAVDEGSSGASVGDGWRVIFAVTEGVGGGGVAAGMQDDSTNKKMQ